MAAPTWKNAQSKTAFGRVWKNRTIVSGGSRGPGKYGCPPNIVTGYNPITNNRPKIAATRARGGPGCLGERLRVAASIESSL
jgi:hypothetical protein